MCSWVSLEVKEEVEALSRASAGIDENVNEP